MELFLDKNAHTKLNQYAIDAILKHNNSIAAEGHPSAKNSTGRAAAVAIEDSRKTIAYLLGTNAENIFFTSSCTSAAQWGMEILQSLHNKDSDIYISPFEHPAVKTSLKGLKELPAKNGTIEPHSADKISCLFANNETGIIQNINDLKYKFLFSDMCQIVGKIKFQLSNLPIDIAVFAGHKFGGSAGIGILYLKNRGHWKSFGTGSRYMGDRTGTPDTCGIVATAAALHYTNDNIDKKIKNMQQFQSILEKELEHLNFTLLGNKNRLPSTSLFYCKNYGYKILYSLDKLGIYVGTGSACSSNSKFSFILNSFGIDGNPEDIIRISTDGDYTDYEAKIVAKEISSIIGNK